MLEPSVRPLDHAPPATPAAWSDRLAERLLRGKLERLRHGRLTLHSGGERRHFGAGDGLEAEIRVHRPAFVRRAALGGTLGAAESYADGDWDTDDLTTLVRLLLHNRELLDGLDSGWGAMRAPIDRLVHRMRRNDRRGARRNVAAHYDLGNDFFSLFLDAERMYSCAIFERPDATLEEASLAKLERVCTKLDLAPSDHLLEIGTGWGGLAVYAARRFGCRVTSVTISAQQAAFARERVAAEGLGDRVEVRLCDYRDLSGRFDKLVSIEMIEAVGHAELPRFFGRCAALLADDGEMLLQSITIADRFFERSKRSVDFIQRFIFPGAALPSVGSLAAAAATSDLTIRHLEEIGPHYATTLAAWRHRFGDARGELERLGFDRTFRRLWHFYFCYCEGGFLERTIGDVQLLLARPACRRPPLLGALR